MMKYQYLSIMVSSVLLAGCAGQSSTTDVAQISTNTDGNIPAWILTPSSANGYAASSCVEDSGHFSIDRNHAVSLARNTLAQNLETKVSVLEKNYQKMNDSAGIKTSGSSFEQIAKQITSVSLQKSQVEQVALVNINDIAQVCALVVMSKTESDEVFNSVVSANSSIDPKNKAALYKEFVAQKTVKELEAQSKSL